MNAPLPLFKKPANFPRKASELKMNFVQFQTKFNTLQKAHAAEPSTIESIKAQMSADYEATNALIAQCGTCQLLFMDVNLAS